MMIRAMMMSIVIIMTAITMAVLHVLLYYKTIVECNSRNKRLSNNRNKLKLTTFTYFLLVFALKTSQDESQRRPSYNTIWMFLADQWSLFWSALFSKANNCQRVVTVQATLFLHWLQVNLPGHGVNRRQTVMDDSGLHRLATT